MREWPVAREQWPFASERRRSPGSARHLGVRWDYGVQLSFGRTPRRRGSRASRSISPSSSAAWIASLNPQEYLLSGLAASVCRDGGNARALALDINLQEVSCLAEGRVDLHGLLGLNPDVPDKIQDVSCALLPRQRDAGAAGGAREGGASRPPR